MAALTLFAVARRSTLGEHFRDHRFEGRLWPIHPERSSLNVNLLLS